MSNPNTAEEIVKNKLSKSYPHEMNIKIGENADYTPPSWVIDAMQEHTALTLDRLEEKVKQRKDDLEEKINKLNLSGNPDDWILANGTEQVRMGVHSVLQLIDEVSDG